MEWRGIGIGIGIGVAARGEAVLLAQEKSTTFYVSTLVILVIVLSIFSYGLSEQSGLLKVLLTYKIEDFQVIDISTFICLGPARLSHG